MSEISKNDYEEPRCLLNMHPEVMAIPTMRVIDKLDEYLGGNDYEGAERHLKFWLEEAAAGHDMRGMLTVLNEQIGLYRKMMKEAECIEAIESALEHLDKLDMSGSVTFATTYINAATGYKAFGKAEEALPLYEKAKEIYEKTLKTGDKRFAGLYNNMAITLASLKQYDYAEALFGKALAVLSEQENSEPDMAITYLNMADLIHAKLGDEEGEKQIGQYIAMAEKLLDTVSIPRDGYYAFVCEKCAPVFGYYGYFMAEKKFREAAEKIYERA